MHLESIYMKSLNYLGKGRFTSAQFARLHGMSISTSKVLIHRMQKNLQLFRVGRGEYVLLSAESFIKLQCLARKNKMLYSIVSEIFGAFPELKAIVLYGSQVRGDADKHSDYDVLLILPHNVFNSQQIREKLEKKLHIKIHLTVYSENGYKNALLSEPYLRFWLSEGLVLDESGIMHFPLPPVPKIAYLEFLSTAKTYFDTGKKTDKAQKKDRYYLTALEMLGIIRFAINLSYDYAQVKSWLATLVGARTLARIRLGLSLDKLAVRRLMLCCKREIVAIDSSLRELGYNESDIYWKNSFGGSYGQEKRNSGNGKSCR